MKVTKKSVEFDNFEELKELLKNEIKNFFKEEMEEKQEKTEKEITLSTVIEMLADKMHKTPGEVAIWLDDLYNVYPAAAFSVLLRTIAIYFDSKYPDYISESPELFIISTLNSKIYKIKKEGIASFENFAAFRTEKEAQKAREILKDYIEEMYKENEE